MGVWCTGCYRIPLFPYSLRMDGFLLVDKPADWTSHDAVAYLRGVTRVRAIGHAGTLDPFATGLLVLGVGAATKKLADVQAQEKEYEAAVVFGATSDTDDRTGTLSTARPPRFTRKDLDAALAKLTGEIEQVPPMYSAKKIGGRKLYDLARQGKTVERKPSRVTVYAIEVTDDAALPARVSLRIRCSSGTYVRALARDLGAALGTGAHLAELRRTAIGQYRVEDAWEPKRFTKEDWQARVLPVPTG